MVYNGTRRKTQRSEQQWLELVKRNESGIIIYMQINESRIVIAFTKIEDEIVL